MRYEFQCDVCGNKKMDATTRLPRETIIPWPALPEGWRNLEDILICERHDVTVICDAGRGERVKYRWRNTGRIERL